MKKVYCISLMIVLFFGVVFHSYAASEQKTMGGTLVIGDASSAQAFGYPPMIRYNARTAAVPAVEHLLDFDISGRAIPSLAKDYNISTDGKAFTFFLREGVKFHDGTECDAEAIKWNLEQFPKAEVPQLTSITSIDIIDKYTVRLNLKDFSNSLIYDLVVSAGMIISPAAAEKNGIKWTYTHPVGTGPFKFESFKRDAYLKYVKFDDYWQKGKPYLDRMEFHYIQDPVAREMALRSGSIDVLYIVGSDPRSIKSLKEKGFKINSAPLGVYGLYPDSKNADSPFSDKRVREAFEYAIDKQSIVDALGFGDWKYATQVVASFRMGYCPDIKGREYNPVKAKQLLADAGYPKGFKTRIIAQNSTSQDLLVALKNYLAEVGIDAAIEACDMGKFNDYYYRGWTNGVTLRMTPSEARSYDAINRQFHPKGRYAISMLKPEKLGKLLEEADKVIDIGKMGPLVQEVVRIIFDEAICCPLFLNHHNAALNPKAMDTGVYDESRTFKVYMTLQDAWLSK